MKVVTAKEMARIEAKAFAEGASEAAFMEEAGKGVAGVVEEYIANLHLEWNITLLCGKGNNAGDAYVAGCYLRKEGYNVRALQLAPIETCSELCQANHSRFVEMDGEVICVTTHDDLVPYPSGIIVDGILGTGFKGGVAGIYQEAIKVANKMRQPRLAIDIPSGVNGTTGLVSSDAIEATATVFLGLPKTGFFIGDAWNYLGKLHRVQFGLSNKSIDGAKGDMIMPTDDRMAVKLPPIKRSRHKYEAGYVAAYAGSETMPGAALMSGYAALKSGAGIVRLLHTKEMKGHVIGAYPELLYREYKKGGPVIETCNEASSCLIGPGLGTAPETIGIVHDLIEKVTVPCVIDADALNILANNINWKLPKRCVLTPHVGEMRRLLGLTKEEQPKGLEWLHLCHQFAIDKECVLVLKGGPSFIFNFGPEDRPWVIPHGDPGMATAGCGDVLTGIIASLLAQGLEPFDAATLGVHIHALAGEAAAASLSSYAMSATDVIDALPDAFQRILMASHN